MIARVFIFLLLAPACFANDAYKVRVKRLEKDLYKDLESQVIIQTRYCYEYTYGDDAVLIDNGFDKKIVFDSGTSCEVKALIK